jgi:UDPglucose--hexose-1-phosphate uridylyltransferase
MLDALDPALALRRGETAVSFVPPFAMYPYEVWLAPRRRVPSPDRLETAERVELGAALGDAMRRLDALFGKPMPYILTVQSAPEGFDETFHMTVEIRPFRRDTNKLKYLAGVEQWAGIFLVDVTPEAAAAALRAVIP